jgi:acyl transferase domain-containing protein
VLLAMKHEEIPPQVHLTKINPKLKLAGRMRIATSRCAWPRTDQPRFAGVASFGVGGTNAHAVVGEAPERVRTAATIERPLHLLTLSAASRNALAKLTERYAVYLAGTEESLADICFTANGGRSHFAQRLAVWADSAAEIVRILRAGEHESLRRGEVQTGATVGLRFPGCITPACVQALFATQPTFLKVFRACEEFLGESLRQSICPAAVFAAEYALGRMWQSWGIDAGAAGGRGVGSLVAGCLAGELDWTKGLTLSASSDVPDREVLPGGERVLEVGLAAGSWQGVLSKVADLHVSGISVDWEGFDRDYSRHRVVLPTYPFERTRCWLDSPELRPLPGPFTEARR